MLGRAASHRYNLAVDQLVTDDADLFDSVRCIPTSVEKCSSAPVTVISSTSAIQSEN